MFYSPSAGGFYPDPTRYPNVPGDLIEIEDAYHAELLAAQGNGQIIVAGTDGVPVAVDPPPADPVELRPGMSLTRRQLLIGLASAGFITEAEAVAWAAQNALPAAVEAMVALLPTSLEQTAARITLASFTVAYRLDPMVGMLAAVAPVPLDDAALDAFFAGYAAV